MAVKLNSTGGGSVTLDSPSTASNYTVTLPSAAGTLATTTGTGSVFTNPTINGFTGDTTAITIGTTQFVKDTSGNIGIGTSSPASKLDVAGEIRIYPSSGTANLRFGSGGVEKGKLLVDSSSNMGFETAGTQRMTLDASGNLGLGVTPSAWSSETKGLQIGAYGVNLSDAAGYQMALANNAYYNAGWKYKVTGYAPALYAQNTSSHIWYTAPSGTAGNAISFTQAMTLDASGRLMVGTTSVASGARYTSSDSNNAYPWGFGNISSLASFYIARATDGVGVSLGWGSTSWTASSDERLKTNLKPIENATQKVSTLRAVTGRYKTDDESVSRSFLIAQDVQAVLPEAVDSEDPERLGVRYTDTIPLLVAAIKELSAQNNALEARLAQLEAK